MEAVEREAAEPEDRAEGEAPPRRNLFDRSIDRIDAFHRRVPVLAVIHAVLKKYGEDRGGQLAMLLAYRGFFSLFPLLLAFVGVLGLLLRDDDMREQLVDSAITNIPVVGSELVTGTELHGSFIVVAGSVLLSLWAGLGLLEMLQEALNTVWEVPRFERPPWILRRLRDLPGVVLLAACAVLSGAARWVLVDQGPPVVREVVGAALPVLAGALAFSGLHVLLCARRVSLRVLAPGALLCGVGWWALQALGGLYVDRIVVDSSDTYGVFVIVLGLLSWSYLLGTLFLHSGELAVVLHERRWPRSLSGRELTDQDRAAYQAISEREIRVRGTELSVEVPRNPTGTPPPG